jgi:hypothetical protein
MSDFTLDSSSLIVASDFEDHIARTERSLDAVSLMLEELKYQVADPLIELQGQAANRSKHDLQLRQLGEKTETAREALDKLMSQTVELKQFQDQFLANIEVLKGRLATA